MNPLLIKVSKLWNQVLNWCTNFFFDVPTSLSWRQVKFLLYLNYSHFVALMCWERDLQTPKSHSINVSTELHFGMQWFFFQIYSKCQCPHIQGPWGELKYKVGNAKWNYSTIVCTFWIKLYTQFVNLRL